MRCIPLVVAMLLPLVASDFISELQSLCGELMARPISLRLQIMCEDLTNVIDRINMENELEHFGWLPSVRNSRDTSSAESELRNQDVSLRTRRGGNYIRFGRSVPVPSDDKGLARETRGDGHYVRFGRSVPDLPNEDMLHSTDGDDDKEKRFMRFGRDPDEDEKDEEKRFMRFGKKDSVFGENSKRFMRFGKRGDDNEAGDSKEKRFMRFGRKDESAFGGDKRFMRFGKREDVGKLDYETSGKRFMRFGKRTQEDIDEKRFMRFGKRGGDETQSDEDEKRFMRFGKRFMRFGRLSPQDRSMESKDIEDDKRFMRFGKKSEGNDLDNFQDSKLVNEALKGSDDKRFMRFGKKSDISDKRFMRFGKRSPTNS